MKQPGMALSLSIRTRFFDADGSGESQTVTLPACLVQTGERWELTYRMGTGEDAVITTLAYMAAAPHRLHMEQRGAARLALTFAAGEESVGQYVLPGIGTLSMSATTRLLENRLGPDGGDIQLDYEAVIGDARRRMVLSLVATPEKGEAT